MKDSWGSEEVMPPPGETGAELPAVVSRASVAPSESLNDQRMPVLPGSDAPSGRVWGSATRHYIAGLAVAGPSCSPFSSCSHGDRAGRFCQIACPFQLC